MYGKMQLEGGAQENPVIGVVRALDRSLREPRTAQRVGAGSRAYWGEAWWTREAGPGKTVDAVPRNPRVEIGKARGIRA